MAEHDTEIKEITRDQLIHRFHQGEPFILIDVLSHDYFERAHLPGSINVPLPVLRDLAPVLFSHQDSLIVYCSNFDCTASMTAYKILHQLGFTDVLEYRGGVQDWVDGGLPVVQNTLPPQRKAA